MNNFVPLKYFTGCVPVFGSHEPSKCTSSIASNKMVDSEMLRIKTGIEFEHVPTLIILIEGSFEPGNGSPEIQVQGWQNYTSECVCDY